MYDKIINAYIGFRGLYYGKYYRLANGGRYYNICFNDSIYFHS